MKSVAMIPIKLNNERLPGKNIKLFSDGTPLMTLIQEACLNAERVDEVYVYCSNECVCDYLLPNVKFIKRPEWLDNNTINCNDIIKEFIKCVPSDYYVVSHATGPFTQSNSIDMCAQMVMSQKYDSGFLAQKILQFFWMENRPLNFDVQHFPRTQDLVPMYCETPGAYIFPIETFQKYGRRVGINPYIQEVSEIESRDIDTNEDFVIADAIYMSIIKPMRDKKK